MTGDPFTQTLWGTLLVPDMMGSCLPLGAYYQVQVSSKTIL